MMLERVIEYISGHEGVEWMPLESMAVDYRSRFLFQGLNVSGG